MFKVIYTSEFKRVVYTMSNECDVLDVAILGDVSDAELEEIDRAEGGLVDGWTVELKKIK